MVRHTAHALAETVYGEGIDMKYDCAVHKKTGRMGTVCPQGNQPKMFPNEYEEFNIVTVEIDPMKPEQEVTVGKLKRKACEVAPELFESMRELVWQPREL